MLTIGDLWKAKVDEEWCGVLMNLMTTPRTLVDAHDVGTKDNSNRRILLLILFLNCAALHCFWNKEGKGLIFMLSNLRIYLSAQLSTQMFVSTTNTDSGLQFYITSLEIQN